MSGHGGARPNSGPKGKYQDLNGEKVDTVQRRIPKVLTEKDIQDALYKKLKEKRSNKDD